MCGEYAECQRYTEQDEHGDEDIPYGDGQCLQCLGRVAVEVAHIEASPDSKVGRGGEDGCCSRYGRHRHGKLAVTLRDGCDEVRYVTSGARCYQNHTHSHHRGDVLVENDNQEEGDGGNQDPLADEADKDRLRFAEHLGECSGFDAESNAVHYDCQGNVQHIHSRFAEVDLYRIKV